MPVGDTARGNATAVDAARNDTTQVSALPADRVVNNILGKPLKLQPSGIELPTHLMKAAMTEWLADPATNLPNDLHVNLYRRWAEGGIGVQLTGNVQVDRRYMENPRNIAAEQQDLEDEDTIALWRRWAKACKAAGSVAIVQLSHGGRQTPKSVNSTPIAPSAIGTSLPGLPKIANAFGVPRAMTAEDIKEVVQRFVTASKLCQVAGFDGIEIHGAHGYLVSSFLSPLANQRTDNYGGSPANRRRLLLEIVQAIRKALPKKFIVGVKLNSADFQRGGFTEEESTEVSVELAKLQVDFLEISGGTYQTATKLFGVGGSDATENESKGGNSEDASQQLQSGHEGQEVKESTKKREAFFIKHVDTVRGALKAVKDSQMKIMLTGGWRSGRAMVDAVESGSVDIIGLGRPLCVDVTFPKRLIAMKEVDESPPPYEIKTPSLPFGGSILAGTLQVGVTTPWHNTQMRLIAEGKEPDFNISVLSLLTVDFTLAYFFDPRKYPNVGLAMYLAYIGSLIAVAAYGWKALFNYYGFT